MRIDGEGSEVLSIVRASQELEGSPVGEDFVLNVSVTVSGYQAADHAWILRHDWDGFLTQLRNLEQTRRGAACLVGASPDDLRLTVQAVDRLGHVAVMGQLGRRSPLGFVQCLRFGFPLDAGLLAGLLRDLEALGR